MRLRTAAPDLRMMIAIVGLALLIFTWFRLIRWAGQ
jgi:hypothetical protein